jgi:hypothetical protein
VWERVQNGYRFIDDDTHIDLSDRKVVTRAGEIAQAAMLAAQPVAQALLGQLGA